MGSLKFSSAKSKIATPWGGYYLNSSRLIDSEAIVDDGYGWPLNGTSSDLSNWIGSQDLTVGAGALTSAANLWGDSVYCGFDGSTYLKNTTITTGANPTFTAAAWVYIADWNAGGEMAIMSDDNNSGAGWTFMRQSTKHLSLFNRTAGAEDLKIDCSKLGAGFHFVMVARAHGSHTLFMVDGEPFGYSTTAAAISAPGAGYFNVGSFANGTSKLTGRIWQPFLDPNTAYNYQQGLALYVASCKRLCLELENGKISVDGKVEPYSFCEESLIADSTSIATEQTLITSKIPYTGKYAIDYHAVYQHGSDVTSQNIVTLRLKKAGTVIDGVGHVDYSASNGDSFPLTKNIDLNLVAGDSLDLTIYRTIGSETYSVRNEGSAGRYYSKPYLRLRKL